MSTNRPRVSSDPKTRTRLPGGSQTGFTGGSAPHRANPGGGAARVPGQSSGGGVKRELNAPRNTKDSKTGSASWPGPGGKWPMSGVSDFQKRGG